ncbi:MAG: signal protein PDZ [Proteobacteria bacterium SG_bin9]|nr:MAG: signal protein PDZ [Proteobacteria bacterium SG_bin9]
MTLKMQWKVPQSAQPRAHDFSFDLDRTLASVVGIHSIIPNDAFTAETLGTERAGNGVLIDRGLILTIGYLITEAQTSWLHMSDGKVVEGYPLGFDPESGFGLVQALGPIDLEPVEIGVSNDLATGDRVIVGGLGGCAGAVAAEVVAKREFAGYWEYLLDEALFTAPSHPNWGGTALLSERGHLAGVGSLQLETDQQGVAKHLNMIVPIDLLKPVLDDLRKFGRVNKPARPWLGMFSSEIDNAVVAIGFSPNGPAMRSGMMVGDTIVAVDGERVGSQADFYRKVWSLGSAGVEVPLTLRRDRREVDVALTSADWASFLKKPRMH